MVTADGVLHIVDADLGLHVWIANGHAQFAKLLADHAAFQDWLAKLPAAAGTSR